MFTLAVYDANEMQDITDDDFTTLHQLARQNKEWIILYHEQSLEDGSPVIIAESK